MSSVAGVVEWLDRVGCGRRVVGRARGRHVGQGVNLLLEERGQDLSDDEIVVVWSKAAAELWNALAN